MIKVKEMMGKGLSAVNDLVDFAKETVKNRKQKKSLRTDENESLLPETKTFNGIPLKDYCWLKDEIFRIRQKRREEGEKDFACKAIMMFSFAFLTAGLMLINAGTFPAFLSFLAFSKMIFEMDSERGLHENELLMSFPEYGIWNSEEVKDFKYNFEDILHSFACRSERFQGREFERIFTMAGIDAGTLTYENNLKRTSLLLNIFYGLNDWESVDEMLYDIRSGEFTAAELFKRKNELCLLEKNFIKKGRLRFRKKRKDLKLERKEIDGKVCWADDKGFIKIREEFSELTKFNEKDIRGLLKDIYPSAEKISTAAGERRLEKGYALLEGEGRRKHLTFFMQEWEKMDGKDSEKEEE